MATTITERPHKYSFSANEVRYVLDVSNPGISGVAVEFELYYLDITASGAGTLLKAFTLTPTSDGKIYCHLKDYLSPLVTPELPDLGGNLLQPVTDQVKQYYIKFREVSAADSNPPWQTEITGIILLGGVEQIKFKRNNFFASYLVNSKPFLTWQPDKFYVGINQPHYITYLNYAEVTSFTVQVKTTFTDGTTNIKTEASPAANGNVLWRINAGAQAWDLDTIDPTKKIHFYEISVLFGATVLASAYKYYIDYRHYYEYWDFNFFNSISGFDCVRVTGEVGIGVEVTGDDREHVIFNDMYTDEKPQPQYSTGNILKKDTYKGDAGFSRTKLHQEALVELLISAGRYEIIDGRWIAVLNLKKSQDLRLTTDKKWSFPVEWSYAYTDTVFTPKSVQLGPGAP